MNTEVIVKKFSEMGARIKIEHVSEPETRSRFGRTNLTPENPIVLNVTNDSKGEVFTLRAFGDPDVEILNINKHYRHLLLMNRVKNGHRFDISKFLCGHDERHWFVAGVDRSAKDVVTAKQSLKPPEVAKAEANSGIAPYSKDAHKHRNKARVRQGEWMFVPTERDFKDLQIHKNEPIRRGRGKPHMCEELVRIGGESVRVHNIHAPNGISVNEYDRLVKDNPEKRLGWTNMTRGMTVYVKGRITHPDHKTVILRGWHMVIVSLEKTSSAVAFLD